MLGLAIDALVLMALLKTISDEDVDFWTAVLTALIASIGTVALSIGFAAIMGIAGIIVAAIVAALLIGVAVSAMFGVEIKRSFLIGGIFMVVHIGIGIGFQLLFGYALSAAADAFGRTQSEPVNIAFRRTAREAEAPWRYDDRGMCQGFGEQLSCPVEQGTYRVLYAPGVRPPHRRRRHALQRVARMEWLEPRWLMSADPILSDVSDATVRMHPLPFGSIHGVKWADLDGDGKRGDKEPGLAGVTIYADLNRDGYWDAGNEPWAITMADIEATDFDEAGQYWLDHIDPGEYVIREVVPNGYLQTYPNALAANLEDSLAERVGSPRNDGESDFAQVAPDRLDLVLAAGEQRAETVTMTVQPTCIRPVLVDVRVSDPDVQFQNVTGTQLNGCGGDVSKWELSFIGDGHARDFSLLFVDAETGGQYARIPVTIRPPVVRGGHLVVLPPNGILTGIDFGNQPLREAGSIQGRKWSDRDGDGQHDLDEPGLANVAIYLDLNSNGHPDTGEPQMRTQRDDPDTDFDEAGWYGFQNLNHGRYEVREVVPDGYVQTFPGVQASVASSETVVIQPGRAIDLDVTSIDVTLDAGELKTELDLTVVWPDGCGALIEDRTGVAVVGNQLIVGLYGEQVAQACPAVITPQTTTIRIPELARGSYTVVGGLLENLPDRGFTLTLAVVSSIHIGPGFEGHVVELAAGQHVEGIDFGNRPDRVGSVHGFKWLDQNGNGIRDDNEPGLAGVTIYLDKDFDEVLDPDEPSVVTMQDDPATRVDESGFYRLENAPAGFYVARELVPKGYEQTFPEVFTCRAVFCNGRGHAITVEPGATVQGINFGNQISGSIHGLKWLDQDGDGQRDKDEPGLAGVVIYADLNRNSHLDEGEPNAETMHDNPVTADDETGRYTLIQVPKGEIVVREIVQPGYEPTYPLALPKLEVLAHTDLPAGRALAYDVTAFEWLPSPEANPTTQRASITVRVIWPDSCGQLLKSRSRVRVEANDIQIRMFGTQVGEACLQVLTPQSQTFEVVLPRSDRYTISALLRESRRPGTSYRSAFDTAVAVTMSEPGVHEVRVAAGQETTGVDFGNRLIPQANSANLAAPAPLNDDPVGASVEAALQAVAGERKSRSRITSALAATHAASGDATAADDLVWEGLLTSNLTAASVDQVWATY